MHSEFCQSIVPLTQDVQHLRPLGEHIFLSRSSTLERCLTEAVQVQASLSVNTEINHPKSGSLLPGV